MLTDSQIYKTVKRSNTTTIILSIIALAIVGVLGYLYFLPYWTAHLAEPRVLTAEEAQALDGSTSLYNVRIDGDRMRDTYYYEETVNEDTGTQVSIDAYFGALRIVNGDGGDDDVYVLVRNAEEIDNDIESYTGAILPLTDHIAVDIHRIASDELNIEMLPNVIFDTTHNESMWYVGTGALAVLGLGGLWGVGTFLSRNSNPAKHPTLRRLSRFGEVEQVVDSIEKDLANGEDKVAKLRLSKNWLVNSGGSNFQAMPYHSIAWVYMMIQQGRYGKTYFLHVYDKTGVAIIIQDKENNVNTMIQAIRARAPWIIAGYNNDIKRNWDKNRGGFIAEVEARHAQYKQQYENQNYAS
jgi:hypothetical protein